MRGKVNKIGFVVEGLFFFNIPARFLHFQVVMGLKCLN